MAPIPVKHIITHEHPDLDAALSVLLFKEYGETRFPGAREAPIEFHPADTLPGGKTAEKLEQEGIIALDIGGGRFDSHPTRDKKNRSKWERCASDLVAEEFGVLDHPKWSRLIEYTRLQDTTGQSLASKDFLHHLVSLNSILLGFQIVYNNDSARILEHSIDVLKYISTRAAEPALELDTQALLTQLADRYLEDRDEARERSACAYENFLAWRARLDEDFPNAFSSENPFDELVSLKSILAGAFLALERDVEKLYEKARTIFDAIIAREKTWCDALAEVNEHAVVTKIGKTTIVSTASANGMVIRAVRYRYRADLIIYRNPENGATSLLVNRRGPLARFRAQNLAAKIRLAECVLRNEEPAFKQLTSVGTIHGWFLHQSNNLIIRGSKKATQFVPSQLSIEDISEIAFSEIDTDRGLPSQYLPAYIDYRRHQASW